MADRCDLKRVEIFQLLSFSLFAKIETLSLRSVESSGFMLSHNSFVALTVAASFITCIGNRKDPREELGPDCSIALLMAVVEDKTQLISEAGVESC